MGDNLKAASRFVSQSISSLDHITTASPLTQDRILDKLADLQRGAKAMRARAIYRAAQAAVDMVHKGQPEDKLHSELGVVRSLVLQYQNGLEEILGQQDISGQPKVLAPAPQDAPIMRAASKPLGLSVVDFTASKPEAVQQPVSETGHDLGHDFDHAAGLDDDANLLDDMMTPLSPPVETAAMSGQEPQNIAAKPGLTGQMTPLVQFAPQTEQREALHRLARLHDEGLQEMRLMSAANLPSTASGVNPASAPKMATAAPSQAFESLMPELTNVVLTTARHMGKTVSISYAAQGVELHVDLADKLRTALSDLSVVLVTRSLETPEARRARDESGAGHISIMAAVKSGLLELSIECTGRDIALSDLEMPSWDALKDMGAAITLGREDGRLCLAVTNLQSKLPRLRKNKARAEWEQAS